MLTTPARPTLSIAMAVVAFHVLAALAPVVLADEVAVVQTNVAVTVSPANPWYWSLNGETTMLLGANLTDHTFLLDGEDESSVQAYLDALVAQGGNLVRNTLSQREPSPDDRPHLILPSGKYDLNQWNESYFERLDILLRLCQERSIVVGIEMWDKFDYRGDYWLPNAWRPANNVTYTLAESGLQDKYDITQRSKTKFDLHDDNPFLRTLPSLDDNPLILKHQIAFFEKALSVTLKYPNVIYFVGNEWKESTEWAVFWAEKIHVEAAKLKKQVPVSLMLWSTAEVFDPEIEFMVNRNDLFAFLGFRVGNPTIPLGEGQYVRVSEVRRRVSAAGPRPLVDVKIRTGNNSFYKPVRQARLWRGLLAGWSALSHHRVHIHPKNGPTQDMGFTPAAQANLRAMRVFSDLVKPWECEPAPELISDRDRDEAYAMANPGLAYGVYFVLAGKVDLEVVPNTGGYRVTWINIKTGDSRQADQSIPAGAASVTLETPTDSDWTSNVGWAATLIAD